MPARSTPAYASPEQLRGEAVNTATDVYSLGAVLYEILAGRTPPASRDPSVGRVIGKPSEAVAEKAARAELAGDLDNIVLKATHPEQERRYPSVDHLSEDLDRYLSGKPVLARRDELVYRAGKFIRRHRLALSGATVLAAGLAIGVILVAWEAHRADVERRRAEQRLDQMVDLANRTLFDVHGAIEGLPGAFEARRKIVNATIGYLDQLAKESGGDPRLLPVLAAGYSRVAELKGAPAGRPSLGDWGGALEAYRKSSHLLEGLLASDPGNPEWLLAHARAQAGIGSDLFVIGKLDEALSEWKRGMVSVEALLARQPKNAEARKCSATLRLQAVQVLLERDPDAARREVAGRLPEYERLAADYPDDPDALLSLALARQTLGAIATLGERRAEALEDYRAQCALLDRVLARRPHDVGAQRELFRAYGHIADTLDHTGDHRMAVDYARRSLDMAETLSASDPASRMSSIDMAGACMRLGLLLPDSEAAEGLRQIDRAASILESAATAHPGSLRVSFAVAQVYATRGERLKRMHRYREALASYRRSLGLSAMVAVQSPGTYADTHVIYAEGEVSSLLATIGERRDTAVSVRKMLDDAARLGPHWSHAVPRSLAWAGDAYLALAARPEGEALRTSDRSVAASYYRQSLEEWAKLPDAVRTNFRPEIDDAAAALERCRNVQFKAAGGP